MRSLLLALVILTAGSALAADVSIGIQIGAPPPPRVFAVRPVGPGPGWLWIEGYWYPLAGHYRWHAGYWTRPPYEGALWVAPRHEGGRYFAGYWDGDHGRFEHDHHWDRGRERDFDRGHDHGRGHDKDREHDRGHGHDRD
ncbi:MAG: hypothetical protein LAP40_22025 [Acidobacteriia bacterium]|nr:hypothetical protein [Terriglobia bacterium]